MTHDSGLQWPTRHELHLAAPLASTSSSTPTRRSPPRESFPLRRRGAVERPMQWSDDGLVLGARRHGETSVILELMTREHGRHLGLVHGGRSKRLQPVLQPGNSVHATWRARLDEHLGSYAVEGGELRSARLIGSGLALYGVGAMAALLRLLPERDPHPALYDTAIVLAEHLHDAHVAPALFVRFEVALLSE